MITRLGKAENQYMLFGATGTMEELERVHIHKGTKIFAFGYAGVRQTFVVYDEEMHAVEICDGNPDEVDKFDLDMYFSPLATLDDTTRPISKEFGIGFYYDESDEVISDEIIEKSLKRAENVENLRKKVKEEKESAEEEMRRNLPKEYPYLEVTEKPFDHKICGKNIRAMLKHHFPTTKFSVKYSSFSGGNSYDITWTDGPRTGDVDKLTKMFQDKHPDEYSMGDYWDCKPSVFNNLFSSVSYVMTSRNISEDAIEKLRQEYSDLTNENAETYHFEEEIDGCTRRQFKFWSVDDILHYVAMCRDLQTKEESKTVTVKVSGKFEIIDYSEKAVAVIGDTKAVKDELKKLGGRFNPRLTCGAGWVFSKKQKAELEKILN